MEKTVKSWMNIEFIVVVWFCTKINITVDVVLHWLLEWVLIPYHYYCGVAARLTLILQWLLRVDTLFLWCCTAITISTVSHLLRASTARSSLLLQSYTKRNTDVSLIVGLALFCHYYWYGVTLIADLLLPCHHYYYDVAPRETLMLHWLRGYYRSIITIVDMLL